jgi:hypothetical protein
MIELSLFNTVIQFTNTKSDVVVYRKMIKTRFMALVAYSDDNVTCFCLSLAKVGEVYWQQMPFLFSPSTRQSLPTQ